MNIIAQKHVLDMNILCIHVQFSSDCIVLCTDVTTGLRQMMHMPGNEWKNTDH